MAMLGFDTHAIFKDFHTAGFTEQQAEVGAMGAQFVALAAPARIFLT